MIEFGQGGERGSVLFVHGAGGGGWEWNVWRRVFEAEGWRTLAPDLMPVAEGLERTTLWDYREQVLDAARQALPEPLVLVGASLGGLLALAASLEAGATALVLVNPLPPAPLQARLPRNDPWPARVPWRRDATLASTRRAMPDADDAAALFAFRRWRDESGAVLESACAGVETEAPAVPTLVFGSEADEDVPVAVSVELANQLHGSLIRLPQGSHVGPLLGRQAAAVAAQAVAWLNAQRLDRRN